MTLTAASLPLPPACCLQGDSTVLGPQLLRTYASTQVRHCSSHARMPSLPHLRSACVPHPSTWR